MSQNGRRRVVITGVGMLSPLGNDPESSWEALVDSLEAGMLPGRKHHHRTGAAATGTGSP